MNYNMNYMDIDIWHIRFSLMSAKRKAIVRKAILKSIIHWHENLDLLMLNNYSNVNHDLDLTEDLRFYRDSCALCTLFFEDGCCSCPLRIIGEACAELNSLWDEVMTWAEEPLFWRTKKYYDKGFKAISNLLETLYKLL